MSLNIVKRGQGYKVRDDKTGRTFSKKPIPKARAERQLKHIEANAKK